MLRASTIIKNAREDRGLSLSDISKKLKINIKYLSSIEEERVVDFPEEPYCSLIIKDYSNYLGLNGNDILSLFRRDFSVSCPVPKNNRSHLLSFTPYHTFRILTVAAVLFFIGYLSSEYIKFNRAPTLNIDWPEVNNSSVVEVSGVTDPESTVRINNDLILVDPSGSFRKTINIATPEGRVVVEARSQSGKVTILEKTYK